MPITSSTTTTPTVVHSSLLSSSLVGNSSSPSSHLVGGGDTFVVTLVKDPQCGASSFGFNVKGGLEFGTPVCIHRVEEGSLSWVRGLRTGQVIHSANGIPFGSITHAEALKVLRSATHLSLVLKREVSSGVGMSSELVSGSSYVWVDRTGKIVGPPSAISNGHGSIGNNRLVNLEINPGQNLGLMIRGGMEYGLGIYVTGVDKGSVAARAGLQRGDEIVEVNGYDFGSITHDKAVGVLKSSRKMAIVARYVGRIPSDVVSQSASATTPSSSDLIDLSKSLVTTGVVSCDEEDEEEEELLYRHHGDTLYDDYAIEEDDKNLELDYAKGLNSDLIVSEDDLLLEDSSGAYVNKKGFGGNSSGGGVGTTTVDGMIEEKARTVLTKSEHSRFTFYRVEYSQGFLPIQTFVRILLELLNTAEKYTLLTEVREIIRRPGDLAAFDELVYAKNIQRGTSLLPANNSLPVTSSSVGAPPPVVTSYAGGVEPLQQQQQQIVGLPGQQPVGVVGHPQGLQHPQHQQVLLQQQQQQQSAGVGGGGGGGSCVRYKVRVGKTKPILGIAIEGGANTNHRLPRVIDVNTEGSAWGSSLKPGQVLLSVDGKGLDGLSHEEIARLIVDCYMDMGKAQIEFVVVETKSSFLLNQQQVLSHLKDSPPTVVTTAGGSCSNAGAVGGPVVGQQQQQRLIN